MVDGRWWMVDGRGRGGRGRLFASEGVEGTGDLVAALFEEVEGLLGRAQVLVAQQFLNPSQIFALL